MSNKISRTVFNIQIKFEVFILGLINAIPSI